MWRREEEKSQAQRNRTKRRGKWMGVVWGRWQTGEKGARKKNSKEENKTKRSCKSEREESETVCRRKKSIVNEVKMKVKRREWGEERMSIPGNKVNSGEKNGWNKKCITEWGENKISNNKYNERNFAGIQRSNFLFLLRVSCSIPLQFVLSNYSTEIVELQAYFHRGTRKKQASIHVW